MDILYLEFNRRASALRVLVFYLNLGFAQYDCYVTSFFVSVSHYDNFRLCLSGFV